MTRKKLICRDCNRKIPAKYFVDGFCQECIHEATYGDPDWAEDVAARSFEKMEHLYQLED